MGEKSRGKGESTHKGRERGLRGGRNAEGEGREE